MAPPTRDVTLTPKPEDRRPCPECQRPGEAIVFKRAVIQAMDTERTPSSTKVGMHLTAEAMQWLPCGHEFDGHTGALRAGE